MAAHRIFNYFGRALVAWLAATALFASEHHGVVKANGLPVPGATVTASETGQKSQITSTDDSGAYAFADLPDGIWTITVEMLGFAKLTREIGVAQDSPSPTWDLKVQSLSDLNAAVAAAKQAASLASSGPGGSHPRQRLRVRRRQGRRATRPRRRRLRPTRRPERNPPLRRRPRRPVDAADGELPRRTADGLP